MALDEPLWFFGNVTADDDYLFDDEYYPHTTKCLITWRRKVGNYYSKPEFMFSNHDLIGGELENRDSGYNKEHHILRKEKNDICNLYLL